MLRNKADSALCCPLCSGQTELYIRIPRPKAWGEGRAQTEYLRCLSCESISMNPEDHLPAEAEKARYDLHQNSDEDEAYLQYLSPVTEWLEAKSPEAAGDILDFGSGPNPALARKLQEKAFQVQIYDPYFHPVWPKSRFNTLICTEVVEHFKSPAQEFAKLRELLQEKGELLVMTQIFEEGRDFLNWHYRRDPTHIFFYSHKAMNWIAENFRFQGLKRAGRHLFVFQP